VVTVNYRLSPSVTHPAHIEDIARAFAWVAENIADYGGDPSRIVVGGHSAGGHLASLLTFDPQYLEAVNHSPDEIIGVLSVSGVYWIDDWIVQWARGAFPKDQKGRDAVSPIKLVHEDVPPFLVLVSSDDYPNLIDEADAMVEALEEADIDVTFARIPERDHYSMIGYIGTKRDKATQVMLDWLNSVFEKAADNHEP
jgi:acetyl esterase/lipase